MNTKQSATILGTLGLTGILSEIGGIGIVGGGIAIGVPALLTVGTVAALGAGACYLFRDDESTTVPPTEIHEDYDETEETNEILNDVFG